ncbi:MAG: hypothetical protein AAB911_00825 [Patescibacteria group bacterium]
MPPTALTTPLKNPTAYTYKIRTMADDIVALKKGQSPAGSTVVLEPLQKITTPGIILETPTLKSETKKEITVPVNKQEFKPAFPEIIFTEPKKPEPPRAIPPIDQIQKKEETAKVFEFTGPPPSQTRPPFAGPINPPFQAQNIPKTLEKPRPLVQKMEPLAQQNLSPTPSLPPRPMSSPPPLPPLPSLPFRPSMPPLPSRPATPPSPITGAAPMNLPSANFPSTSIPPTLPPLPAVYSSAIKKKSMIILLAGAVVVVIFIIGEIWWFFLKPAAAPVAPANETNNILPPPQELQPLLPPQETSVNTPSQETSTLPKALLSYNRVEIITVESISPAEIAAAVNDFDTTTIGTDELARLVIKIENAEIALDQNQLPSNNIVTLENIAAGLKLKIPAAIKNELLDDYDLFIYGSSEFDKEICQKNKNTAPSCSGPRLGLALKTTGETKINSAAKIWEKTMASDLKNLILAKTTSAGQFQTGTYQGQTIRYKNLPISAIAIEYALVNDVLIIGTSKSSTLKAIDAAGVSETNE